MPRVPPVTRAAAQRLFALERARFARLYPVCADAVLAIVDAPCPDVMPDCGERNVGWCYPASGDVYLLSRALLRGPATVTALIRHELAHVARPEASERATDALASRVGGRLIRYDRDDLQTIAAHGRKRRPAYLPK